MSNGTGIKKRRVISEHVILIHPKFYDANLGGCLPCIDKRISDN